MCVQNSIVDCHFNDSGDVLAYAVSYDWAKGSRPPCRSLFVYPRLPLAQPCVLFWLCVPWHECDATCAHVCHRQRRLLAFARSLMRGWRTCGKQRDAALAGMQ